MYRVASRADSLSLRLLDLGVAAVSWTFATLAAFEASDEVRSTALMWILPVAIVIQVVCHRLAGLYGPVWRYASVDEAVRVVRGVIIGAVAATTWIAVAGAITDTGYPLLTAPALAILLMLLGCGGFRFQARLFALERQQAKEPGGLATVIVGAGPAGAALAYELVHTQVGRDVDVIGFVDDDPAVAGRSVRGIPVLGTVADLDAICADHSIDRILISSAPADRAGTKAIVDRALRTSAQVKVLPPTTDRVDGPLVKSIRDLDITDLLGRDHAPVDIGEIGEYLAGQTVLVTGAGGSIGSEIARQVANYAPGRLLLLDRDETLLHDVAVGPLASAEPILADICDDIRVREVFSRYRPDVVFHAAAQKHVPILERFPVEAVRVNVFGTWGLVRAAAEFGCQRFVHISTDKAADPCSVMGATKRAAEQIVFEVGRRYYLPFVAVRFGNVLGSRGSVVPTFLRQIVEGGPVTVTSPDMPRYFMTIPEACSLVLQSGAMASDGRIFLLDMGEPVSILSLANQMIRLAGFRPGEDIEVVITGTRPGERLHERLHDDAEVIEPSSHCSISSLNPKTPWEWEDLIKVLRQLKASVDARNDDQVRLQLEAMLRHGGVECDLATVDLPGTAADPIDLRDGGGPTPSAVPVPAGALPVPAAP